MTASLPLMKSVLTPLAKNLLMPVTAMSLTNTTIQKKKKKKKIHGSGTTALIMSNEEMKDIMKIFKSLKKSGLLIKKIKEKIKTKAKEQKGGFFQCNYKQLLL